MSAKAAFRPRFDKFIGFVSPPKSFDYSAQQFLDLCADFVGVIQHMGYFPGAGYGPEVHDGEARLASLKEGISGLRDAGVQLVAQAGGYWSLAYAPDLNTADDLENTLSDTFGVEVLLNWTAIVRALRDLGAQRIAVTTGYYRPAWTAATIAFLESAGFEILWSGDLIDQGILPDEQAKLEIEQATLWDYPDEIVRNTCIDAAQRAPDCDVVCQTGAGMRTSNVAAAVEAATGKPLVATDIALYWAVLKAGGLKSRKGVGRLLESA